jgi:hypothetical protein
VRATKLRYAPEILIQWRRRMAPDKGSVKPPKSLVQPCRIGFLAEHLNPSRVTRSAQCLPSQCQRGTRQASDSKLDVRLQNPISGYRVFLDRCWRMAVANSGTSCHKSPTRPRSA